MDYRIGLDLSTSCALCQLQGTRKGLHGVRISRLYLALGILSPCVCVNLDHSQAPLENLVPPYKKIVTEPGSYRK